MAKGGLLASRLGVDGFAAAEAQMIVAMASLAHDAIAVPIRGTPAAMIGMRPDDIEDKPTAFHLRVPIFSAWIGGKLISSEG